MFLTRSEYDRGVNTFSPEGRLFQVEYAIEAIKLGSTTVGIKTEHGVVLAVEKRVQSPLLESSSIEKIMEIDRHLGCAMSGLTADARTMIDHARVTAQNHAFTYDEKIKVESVTQAVCDLALRFGESVHDEDAMMSRPFGVALLIAGIDELGPQLFHTDPSGTFVKYQAKAIGSGSEAAQAELQDKWYSQMTLQEAQILTLRVLKQVMEEKLDHHNVQLAQVTREKGFEILDEQSLKPVIDLIVLSVVSQHTTDEVGPRILGPESQKLHSGYDTSEDLFQYPASLPRLHTLYIRGESAHAFASMFSQELAPKPTLVPFPTLQTVILGDVDFDPKSAKSEIFFVDSLIKGFKNLSQRGTKLHT
uniref:Putative proteasome subunit alpha type 5 n=1 Tax=Moniliophthora roreri TaxID=221103 RepID=A0A0W0G8U6_MONRR